MKRHAGIIHNDDQLYKSLLCLQPACMVNSPTASSSLFTEPSRGNTGAQSNVVNETVGDRAVLFKSYFPGRRLSQPKKFTLSL